MVWNIPEMRKCYTGDELNDLIYKHIVHDYFIELLGLKEDGSQQPESHQPDGMSDELNDFLSSFSITE